MKRHDPNQGSLFGSDPHNPAPVPVPPERVAAELPGQQFLPIAPVTAPAPALPPIDVLAEAKRLADASKPVVVQLGRHEAVVSKYGSPGWSWSIREIGAQVATCWTDRLFDTRNEAQEHALVVLRAGKFIDCAECHEFGRCDCPLAADGWRPTWWHDSTGFEFYPADGPLFAVVFRRRNAWCWIVREPYQDGETVDWSNEDVPSLQDAQRAAMAAHAAAVAIWPRRKVTA